MATATNVSVGKPAVAGAVFAAPKGTTLPTTADGALDGAFNELGFVSEDGVTNSNSADSESVKDWGGQTVLVINTSKEDTFTLTLIESLNAEVLKTVYGASNVSVGGESISVTVNANAATEKAFVIDMALTGGALKRIVIPCGRISELGEITYKDNEPIGYEITITALPDSSGNNHYEYIKQAAGVSYALSISPTTLTVAKNASSQITPTTTPAGQSVVWGTSDASKATVSQTGLVTGVAAGSATITATFGGITKSCEVTVTN